MVDKTLVNFETYKRTRSLSKAEQTQRIYNWSVNAIIDFLKQGKINDAYDCIYAGLLIEQNKTTDYERTYYDRMLSEIGSRGFENEEKELRWRLQKYLRMENDR